MIDIVIDFWTGSVGCIDHVQESVILILFPDLRRDKRNKHHNKRHCVSASLHQCLVEECETV